jgi:OmpA-OmpF porin, OOP family
VIAIKKTTIVFLFLAVLIPFSGFSQEEDSLSLRLLSPAQLKRFGKNAMLQKDYSSATDYFVQYFNHRKDNYKVAFLLAESYRHNRDYEKAMEWYDKSYLSSERKYLLPLFYFALMQKVSGDCDKAKVNFESFRKQARDDKNLDEYKKRVKNEVMGCDSLGSKESSGKIFITHLDSTINKVHVEAAPFYLNENTLIYSALRTDRQEYVYLNEDSLDAPLRKLYKATRNGDEWVFAGELEGPFNDPTMHVSGGSFSEDGNKFYFSKCAPNWKGQVICALYFSELENGQWTEPLKLDKSINNPKYSSSQPSVANITGIETVYFVSNKPGGKGGYDIWFFTYNEKKKQHSVAKNAGSKVNTSGDEMSPFYDKEFGTLYFSSTGWPGIGGYDVYKTIGQFKKFIVPENLGQPINSTYDDLFYTISPQRDRGMLVSNRKGGNSLKNATCCDDLYEFQKRDHIKINFDGNVLAGLDSLNASATENALINLYIINPVTNESSLIKTITANEQGAFSFVLEAGNNYKISAEKDGYWNSSSFAVNTSAVKTSTNIQSNFFLKSIPADTYLKLDNVYYATDKHDLTPDSKVVLDSTLLVLLVSNPLVKIEIASHTDDQGADTYNMKLSQRRADGVVKYLVSKGISPDRLVAKGYGKTKPVASNDSAEGREKNRRTEFKVIGKIDKKEVDIDEE